MKKRILSLILALAMLCALLPQAALTASAETYSGSCGAEGDNLTWSLDTETGVLTITGTGAMKDYSDYYPNKRAPWYDYGSFISDVSLPTGLTKIGDWAFNCCDFLVGVTIPNSVTSIGNGAFSSCNALTDVTIPVSVTSIGYEAFSGCSSLTGVTIGNGVTNVGRYAFSGCSSLTSVTIPDSVTTIDDYTFSGCSSLTSVTIGNGVTDIGSGIFYGCDSLNEINVSSDNPYFSSINGLVFNKDQTELRLYPAGKQDTFYQIPDSVTSIGYRAFWNCSALTSVTIPDSVTSIGFGAFEGCSSLTSVTIPDSVLSIDWYSFHDCSSLTSVTIGNGVTSIGGAAFSDCIALTSVSIGSSVASIDNGAFDCCTSLVAFSVSSDNQSFSSIDGVLFNKAQTELIQYPAKKPDAHYVIPSSVTSISGHAFSDCTLLTDVVIPAEVNSISHFAFKTCLSLTGFTVDCENAVYSSMDGILLNREKTNLIQYPIGRTNSSYTIPDSVTSIEVNAFLNCSNLTSVTVPESVTSIGRWAFGYYDIRVNVEMGARARYDDFTIYGYNGTASQDYAESEGFPFTSLDNAVGEFVDVAPSDYFANPVLWAINHEPAITAGVGVHSFGPSNDCTREQIVTFLWAANGKPEPEGTGSEFSDVPADAWYYKPVMWAVENKITSGIGDGSFGVGQPCTRAQAMTFLWASQGKPAPSSMESPFSDVSSSDWFCKAILWAAENGITKGVGNGLFGVNNTCTRAQIITFLYKAYNK